MATATTGTIHDIGNCIPAECVQCQRERIAELEAALRSAIGRCSWCHYRNHTAAGGSCNSCKSDRKLLGLDVPA